jgi:zinc transporter ZupT
MLLNAAILFMTALLGGFTAYRLRSSEKIPFKATLTFAGAYLFAVTVVHVLPEVFITSQNTLLTGIIVLGGFYLQQVLEYFTSGAEHGHLHPLNTEHQHNHKNGMAISLVMALSLHAFLEGTLLGHPSGIVGEHDNLSLMMGIVLHKLPAAFAMMTILICYYKKPRLPIIYLLVFAIASPLGMLFSYYGVQVGFISLEAVDILFALVAGSFLHISTTIVFEGSPGHKFNTSRLAISMFGALAAILVELIH